MTQNVFAYLAVCCSELETNTSIGCVERHFMEKRMKEMYGTTAENRWICLMGFFCSSPIWKARVSKQWRKRGNTNGGGWEKLLEKGVQMAKRYGRKETCYINMNLGSKYDSILGTLQERAARTANVVTNVDAFRKQTQ